MRYIQERGSTHVYHVRKMDKDEINSMVNLCVYEQPAFCNAACPLKLDTRSMISAVASGDFKKALQLYEKIAPFPLILSFGCDAPCESKCRLSEIGDGISIKNIEETVSIMGEQTKTSGVFRMRKKKKAAIFGTDLFCLLLSGELEKKAYPVTVFCEEPDLSGYLYACAPFLDGSAFDAELKRLCGKDIEFVFNSCVSPSLFSEKRGDYDILCADEKTAHSFFPNSVCDESIMAWMDEKLVIGAGNSVMEAALNAKKAALTVDRLAQGVDPHTMRGEEAAVESRLYTDLSSADKLCRVDKTGTKYSKEEAVNEAGRCIQCRCEECMKSCAFLAHYRKYPALLSREIYNNTQIIMGDHQLNKPMNSCSLCGQCKVVCPSGFDMAHVCKSARENMVSTDKMPLAPHEFALMDMFFSNEEAFLSRNQPGYDKCRYVFFPGCQAVAVAPETIKAAYMDLCQRLEGGVALMLGCCGAICDWAGRYEMYDETVSFIEYELKKLDEPVVITACPTCKKELSSHYRSEIKGIWDILLELGLPDTAEGLQSPAAMHDSCGARGDSHIHLAIRAIAEMMGCKLVDTYYSGDTSPCCGYGGLTAYANREVAKDMTDKCLEQSNAPYISYCMACRDRFAREGRESKHILELVYGTDAGDPPDISQKRVNRLSLKQELMKDIWNEEVLEIDLGFDVLYTDKALAEMDDRMILKSDVEQVLIHVKESGEAVLNEDSGLYTACKRLGNVTFWVKYTADENTYLVHGAYSHRMNIVLREG